MEMPKPSEADKQRFRDLVPEHPNVEIKPMFGNLGGFVNGNMFMGLFGPSIGLKLSGPDADALLAHDGAGPFGPSERPMGGYVAIPNDWGEPQAAEWVNRALVHVSGLPPKKPKGR
jgi:TfoX/Sxy family transcriptional regulator of competence genes